MKLIKEAGLKTTPSRTAVLGILEKEQRPIDAADLIKELRWQNVPVDQATVYRILEAFYDKGIIDRLEFGEGKYRYEIKRGDHHHLICDNCGSVEDVEDLHMKSLEKEIEKNKGFRVKSHSLEFFGVCRACQR